MKTDPIRSDDLISRSRRAFPVYACGYNWLKSNDEAAKRLADRIEKIIKENNSGPLKCEQVILVTHSMGGLVARACAQLPGMEEKIVGVVHGVMPATGAAVAYRRCKLGMQDEAFVPGQVIGASGRDVTAVFAQAPGALQLLPSQDYRKHWLKVKDDTGGELSSLPKADPYEEIYLRKDRWWGLVNEEWLHPVGGMPISWDVFSRNIRVAKEFHVKLSRKYHPKTFVIYGAGSGSEASFETIIWTMAKGIPPDKGARPTAAVAHQSGYENLRVGGPNVLFYGGESVVSSRAGGEGTLIQKSFWEIRSSKADGRGDGTVPESSGAAPRSAAGSRVLQQFRLEGFSHEAAYKNAAVQRAAVYALTKIAGLAKDLL